MKKLFKLVVSALLIISPACADVLYLNEGEEIIGKLVRIKEGKVVFTPIQGTQKEIEQSKVAHILISKIRKGDEINNINEINDPVVQNLLKNLPNVEDFPDSDYITLFRNNDFSFNKNGERVLLCREIIQVLREPGLNQANNSIYYFHENESCELLFAHTYSPDGNVFHITDDAVSLESIRSGKPEYARLKKLKMALKKVDIGSIIDYCYTRKLGGINEINPKAISYIFGEREPVLKEVLTIRSDEGMDFSKHLLQWPAETPVQFVETQENQQRVWKWTYSDLKGYIPEQNMLPAKRIFPRIVAFQNYPWEKTAQSLAKAYEQARPRPESLQELLQKAGITQEMSKFQKAAAIYETINREIRDIGVSITQMGSFAPVSTQTTLSKKYGNTQSCLALMHFALESLGIESYPGFCSDKRENASVKEFANLGCADYAILKVVIDGIDFYTDGGSIYRPFGTLSTGLQGASACFIDLKKPEFHFARLPQTTFDWNRYERNVLVNIKKNGDMDVNEILHFRGPYEANIRELKSIKDQEKRNYAEKRVKQVHPNAVLESFGFSAMENLSSPAVLTLRYSIPKAAQKASEDIMTFTNFWVSYQSSSASLSKRKFPMQYWATEENSQTIVFQLPENFAWVPWDRQFNFSSGPISFSSNINQHESQLIYADRFIARQDEYVSDEQYQNYRNCILTMSELANQWIIIERDEVAPVSESLPASFTPDLNNPASATTPELQIEGEPQG